MTKITGTLILAVIMQFTASVTHAQFRALHFSGSAGYGAIKGNSPAQESLFFSAAIGTGHEILGDVELRFGYLYARKITYFLPEDRTNKYYPYIHSFSLKGFIKQSIKSSYFLHSECFFIRFFKKADLSTLTLHKTVLTIFAGVLKFIAVTGKMLDTGCLLLDIQDSS